MGESDGTSASAASSGGDSSPHACSAAEQNPRVDFYVIEGTAAAARLKVACRLAEKAYLAAQRALIWHTERAELEALDELLWTFADGSFVPHDWLTSNAAAEPSETRLREYECSGKPPVLLCAGPAPAEAFDFVVNLAADPPPFLHLARRIAEIVDGDEG